MPVREILYRGKRKDNGEWVYGYPLIDTADCSLKAKCDRPRDGGAAGILYWDDAKRKYGYGNVVFETIGEYTGLTDRNGVKIFEGDIVRSGGLGYPTKPAERIYEVKYSTEWARFLAVLPNGVFNPTAFQDCEVIGNIHDNPELLEGGGEV